MSVAVISSSASQRFRAFEASAALSVAFLMLSIIWGIADGRMIDGQPVWAKPAKFALSFVVYFGTLAWAVSKLSATAQSGLLLRWTGWITSGALLFEFNYIAIMAARGEASHFNKTAVIYEVLYGLMGAGALLLMVCAAIVGWLVLKDRSATLSAKMRAAIGWGFIGSAVLTTLTAFVMGAIGRHVGVHPDGGAVVPLLGWSMVVGDLRPSHFVALHIMQVLPLTTWLLHGRGGSRAVAVSGLGWAALVALLFLQAIAGHPIVPA